MNSTRPSYKQLERMTEFLEAYPKIARGHCRTTEFRYAKKKKWESLALSINALGNASKDGRGWAKYWAEKKCALKKLMAQLYAKQVLTGSKAELYSSLTVLDRRLVAVIGTDDFNDNQNNLTTDRPPDLHPALSEDEQLEEIPTVIVEKVEMEEVVAASPTTTSPALSADESSVVIRAEPEEYSIDSEVQISNSMPEAPHTSVPVENITSSSSPFEDAPRSKKKKVIYDLCESILRRKTEKHGSEDKIIEKHLEVLEIQKQQEIIKLESTKKLVNLDIELKKVQLESARLDLERKRKNYL